MRKMAIWCLLPCLQALAFGAAAQEAYVVGSVGSASYDFAECAGFGSDGCQSKATAWRVGAGYRFNRVVALEGFHFDFGRARSSVYSLEGTFGGTAQGVEVLVGWQGEALEVAGKIGLARVRSDYRAASGSLFESTSATHTEVMGGLMGAWQIAPNVALRLDLDLVTLALNSDAVYFSRGANLTTLLLGVVVRF
jgi:hypothetical protein